MDPGILEAEPGAVYEIHDGCRDEDVAGVGDGHDPGRHMDRDPADVAGDHLNLSGVDAGSDREAQALGGVADGSRGPNGALGSVELGEHAVAGGLDELSPLAIDRRRGLAVVLSDDITPA